MKSYMVPDAAVGVLHNWIEEDGAACAAQELDRVIDFLIKLHNEDAEVHIPADTRSAFPVISVQSPVSIQCCWQS